MPGAIAVGTNEPITRTAQFADQATEATAGVAKPAGGYTLCNFIIPAGFDGTTLGFEVSLNDIDYYVLKDNDGTDLAITVAADSAGAVDPAFFYGWNYIKPTCSAQSGASSITLVFV